MAFWEGHVVQSVHEQADGSLLINLSEEPHKTACCDQYGQPACFHERRWRRVRERDGFDRRVWLNVQVLRMNCPHCGGGGAWSWTIRPTHKGHRHATVVMDALNDAEDMGQRRA